MRVSIYLHDNIIAELKQYGDLQQVIDQILALGEAGKIDLCDKPRCKDRDGARRLDIIVTNSYYIDMLQRYPPHSTRVSLRRLIYWFVENDLCTMLSVDDRTQEHLDRRASYLQNELEQLATLAKSRYGDQSTYYANIVEASRLLKELQPCATSSTAIR